MGVLPFSTATGRTPGRSTASSKDRATCLDSIRPGGTARIAGFSADADPVLCQRLQDLGFHPGAEVSCLRVAPLGCPLMLRVGNADLCLRKQQARSIQIDLVAS
ncbi:ferrous iron transport protein A [Kocuria sp. JC486]|uniref:FeoA domain-containing protein n=1 Tax=Kocuria sp. JC486 TaxID=1970736 RepID=UPI0014232FF2|nr:ferrous iron transport protein A [Kocuria sp. JC486]